MESWRGGNGVAAARVTRARLAMRIASAVLLLAASTPIAARAQVGHPPGTSPYRDVARGHTVTALGGYIGGGGGELEIGPHSGEVFGVRYDIRSARTIQMGLVLTRGSLDRLIVNPAAPAGERTSGPVGQTVTFAELDLQFNVTGQKSWRRLVPFLGAGAGVAFGEDTPSDPSDYDFGNKFYFTPQLGTRLFITDHLHLRAEARAAFWKLSYPVSFRGDSTTNPNAVLPISKKDEWTSSGWLQVGLGYGFSP